MTSRADPEAIRDERTWALAAILFYSNVEAWTPKHWQALTRASRIDYFIRAMEAESRLPG